MLKFIKSIKNLTQVVTKFAVIFDKVSTVFVKISIFTSRKFYYSILSSIYLKLKFIILKYFTLQKMVRDTQNLTFNGFCKRGFLNSLMIDSIKQFSDFSVFIKMRIRF